MPVSKNTLGMNARNFLYIRKYNRSSAKLIADDKLVTKKILMDNAIATPNLLASFYDREEIKNFNWNILPIEGFVIKPARGYAGEGILPIKKWENNTATTITQEIYTVNQLESHILDILEGAYSLQFLPDKAFIEERIILDPFFKKLEAVGIPDLRIIVLNHIPVMAMLRLSTAESHGKANLHQGALGIGIDMRTGITTHAIYKGKPISFIPNTKIKTRGIMIPQWDTLLLLATKTQSVIPGLGYAGVDIVLDAKRGPLVLEVNARPGLSIQVANNDSLRTRLERIENIPISTPARGIEVAKSLFAEAFSEKVQSATPQVLDVIQEVILKTSGFEKIIRVKLDTGAHRSSIDEELAAELNLSINDETVHVKSASGQTRRPTVNLTFEMAGKKISTVASVVDRAHMSYPMIVGRVDLKGFLVNPHSSNIQIEETLEDEANL